MFDIKAIRDNPEAFDTGMARRGLGPQSPELLAIDSERRAAIAGAQAVQTERNARSKAIGAARPRARTHQA